MFHTCAARFDITRNLKILQKFFELNKAQKNRGVHNEGVVVLHGKKSTLGPSTFAKV